MSWKREGDTVTVSMSLDDWGYLLIVLGYATAAAEEQQARQEGGLVPRAVLSLLNRLNEGNTHFRPYAIPEPAEANP